jgi:hypothetical protein
VNQKTQQDEGRQPRRPCRASARLHARPRPCPARLHPRPGPCSARSMPGPAPSAARSMLSPVHARPGSIRGLASCPARLHARPGSILGPAPSSARLHPRPGPFSPRVRGPQRHNPRVPKPTACIMRHPCHSVDDCGSPLPAGGEQRSTMTRSWAETAGDGHSVAGLGFFSFGIRRSPRS